MYNPWFENSCLYKSAYENDRIEDFLEHVPDECKFDLTEIINEKELIRALKTYNFWIVNDIPDFLIDYFITHKIKKSIFSGFQGLERIITDSLILVSEKKYFDAYQKSKSNNLYKNLLNKNLIKNPFGFCLSIKNNDLFIYTHKKGHEIPDNIKSIIVADENVELLEYMLSNSINISYDPKIATLAVRNNNIKLLKSLHAQGNIFNGDICTEAVKYSNLECLQFLHSIGYELTEKTINAAIESNKLDCLTYIHENIFHPFRIDLCYVAVRNETIDNAIERLRKGEFVNLTGGMFNNNNLKCLRFLVMNGYRPCYIVRFFIEYLRGKIDCNITFFEWIKEYNFSHYFEYHFFEGITDI